MRPRPVPFLDGDKVHVVEHDPRTRQPKDGGKVLTAVVVDRSGGEFTWLLVRVRMPDGGHAVFWRGSRWLHRPFIASLWRLEVISDAS